MRLPGGVIGKALVAMFGKTRDQRAGQTTVAQVGKGICIDHVVGMTGAQHGQKIQSAFALGGAEPREMIIADLRADPIARLVARTGVIRTYPVGRGQTRPQHITRLVDKAVLAGDQQAHDLPARNIHANGAQLCRQATHSHLALMVLVQHEAAQRRTEMTVQARRQRSGDGRSVRRQPPLTPIAHDVRAQHQILHHEVLVALETRTGRHRGRDHPILVDAAPGGLVAAAAMGRAGGARRLGLRCRFHARRLQRRARRHALEPRNLVALGRDSPFQLRHARQQRDHQRLQVVKRQLLQVGRRHSRIDSDKTASREEKSQATPGLLPLLP